MASKLHGKAMETALQAWVTAATSVELRYLTGYTPDPDDSYLSDIASDVASGAPTPSLASITVTYNATENRIQFDFTNPSDASITTNTNGIAIIDNTGVAATSEVLYTADTIQLQPTDGTLSLTIDAAGLFALGTNAA